MTAIIGTRVGAASQKVVQSGAESKGGWAAVGGHLFEAQPLWPLGRMMSISLGQPENDCVH